MRFFFVPLSVLFAGLVRNELAAQLWGIFFVSLFLYLSIAVLVSRRVIVRLFRDQKDEFLFNVLTKNLKPAKSQIFRIHLLLPPLLLPGVTVRCLWKFQSGSRQVSFCHRLTGGRNEVHLDYPVYLRGKYQCNKAVIRISDPAGIFVSELPLEVLCHGFHKADQDFNVLPRIDKDILLPVIKDSGGEVQPDQTKKIRTQDLLEVRQYFPGDDLRRLNWKVFAHTGDLFLRIGEDAPPPQSEIVVLWNPGHLTNSPLYDDPAFRGYCLDRAASVIAGLVHSLQSAGYNTLFYSQSSGLLRNEQVNGKPFLTYLSQLPWESLLGKPPLEVSNAPYALSVSLPGMNAEALNSASVCVFPLLKTKGESEPPLSARLLKIPGGTAEDPFNALLNQTWIPAGRVCESYHELLHNSVGQADSLGYREAVYV